MVIEEQATKPVTDKVGFQIQVGFSAEAQMKIMKIKSS